MAYLVVLSVGIAIKLHLGGFLSWRTDKLWRAMAPKATPLWDSNALTYSAVTCTLFKVFRLKPCGIGSILFL